MDKNQALYAKAKKLIPGGTQLLSKRPELHLPGLWPTYYEKAKGCRVWDLNGREYLDASYMGIGACILGYADADVDRAVLSAVKRGTMTTLNCPEEVELAELLCDLHPWAKMARFARTGGEAMSVAVRIARAYKQKSAVLFSGYHGWHDWYLSANIAGNKRLDGHLLPGLKPSGVARQLKSTAIPFYYNDTEGFLKLIRRHEGQLSYVFI
jgi:glutamate-1-semialdehyde 2,1-aminomutase